MVGWFHNRNLKGMPWPAKSRESEAAPATVNGDETHTSHYPELVEGWEGVGIRMTRKPGDLLDLLISTPFVGKGLGGILFWILPINPQSHMRLGVFY